MITARQVSREEYVGLLPAFTSPYITQAPQWPAVKRGWQVDRFAAFDSGAPDTCLALAQMLSTTDRTSGKALSYIARGPLSSTDQPQAVHEIIRAAHTRACELAATAGTTGILRIDPPWYDGARARALLDDIHAQYGGTIAYVDDEPSGQPHYTMVLDLKSSSYEQWFASIQGKRRTQVRRAERAGITCFASEDPQLIPTLADLIAATGIRKGLSYRPKEYFADLFAAFPTAFFVGARTEEKMLSLSLNIEFGGTIFNLYTGNDFDRDLRTAPMAHSAYLVKESFARGADRLDLCGCFAPDDSCSLYQFKRYITSEAGLRCYVGSIDLPLSS